jgi:hypothetical protein
MRFRLVTAVSLLMATPAAPEVLRVGQPHYQPTRPVDTRQVTPDIFGLIRTAGGTAPACVDSNHKAIPCIVDLQYFGGHVLSNVKVYAVFWPGLVSSDVQSGVPGFYAALTDSGWMDWLAEYSTTISAGAGTHAGQAGSQQVIGRGTFGGSYTLGTLSKTYPACAAPDAALTCLADADVAGEINWQVSQGHLPAPDASTVYVLHFPSSIRISDPNMVSCKNYCAYHGTYQNAAKQSVPYVVVPDLGANGCQTGCGGGTTFENTCVATSHEIGEVITDAEVGLANGPDFPLAWYDNASPSQGEIGDMCKGDVDTVGPGGLMGCTAGTAGCYFVQQLFSRTVWNASPASQPNVAACVASRYDADDYSIALSPNSLSLGAGGTSQPIPILTQITSGAPVAVTLSVTALPPGVHASIDVASVSVGSTANLTVSADPGATPVSDGVLVVQASGSTTHSAALLVQVDNGPSVTITSPTNGATVSGSTLISVTATPGSNTVLSTISMAVDGNAPFFTGSATSTTWDSRRVSNASHILHVTALDADGGRATASLNLVVDNGAAALGNGIVGGCSTAGGGPGALATLLVLGCLGLHGRRRPPGGRAGAGR